MVTKNITNRKWCGLLNCAVANDVDIPSRYFQRLCLKISAAYISVTVFDRKSWGVSNSGALHMDRSTSARHVGRSTVERAGAQQEKQKWQTFTSQSSAYVFIYLSKKSD